MAPKPTTKDIAKLAGVSQATVSYVLNDKKGKTISEETRSRVLKIASEIGYIPNLAAKRLKQKATKCVAIRLATTLAARRYHLILQGIRSYLLPKGYSLLLCGSPKGENDMYPDYITACLSGEADGIIYITSDNRDIPEEELEIVQKHKLTLTLVDYLSDIENTGGISYNYFASTYNVAQALLSRGFRNFVYIRPEYDNIKEDLRERGARTALGKDGITLRVIRASIRDINSSSYLFEGYHVYGPAWNSELKRYKDFVYDFPTDTAYISTGAEAEERLARYMYERWLVEPEAFHRPWYEGFATYHFNHYDIGAEAARLFLNALDGFSKNTRIEQQPVIDYYTEDSF